MAAFYEFATTVLSASVVLGFVVWLSKNIIITRLTSSVKHEYNAQLENLKAELRGKSEEIASIRDMALASAKGHSNAIEIRKLEAIDDLWRGFLEFKKCSGPLQTIAHLNKKNVAKRVTEPKLQMFLATLFPDITKKLQDEIIDKAAQAEPWVSRLAWAYYAAYSGMVYYVHAWGHTAQIGIDPSELTDHKTVNKLMAEALPNYTIKLNQDNSHLFVEASNLIELKLLMELKESIKGHEVDAAAVERAKNIMIAVNSLQEGIAAATQEKLP